MALAKLRWVMPIGFKNSSSSISPGWVGVLCVGIRIIVPSYNFVLMVICNFNIFRAILSPYETNAVSIVYADAMLSFPAC